LWIKLRRLSIRIDASNARRSNAFSRWGCIVQHWHEDLEETLSFAERRIASKPVRIDVLTRVETSKAVALAQPIKPKDKFFEREDIRQRLAAFRATQRRFEIERDEYFKKTMANLHANSF
jgi:hypothetical protein